MTGFYMKCNTGYFSVYAKFSKKLLRQQHANTQDHFNVIQNVPTTIKLFYHAQS